MLWEIDIHPAARASGQLRQPDRAAERVAAAARELGLAERLQVAAARGFLLQGASLRREQVERLANELLADVVVERAVFGRPGDEALVDCGLRIDFGELSRAADSGLKETNPQSEIRNHCRNVSQFFSSRA